MAYAIATDELLSLVNIKDIRYHIQPVLVSRKCYEEKKPSGLMNSDFLDLKVCYGISHRGSSMFIPDSLPEAYGIPASLIRTQALENIRSSSMYSIESLDDILARFGVPGMPYDTGGGMPTPIYVLTNTAGYLGAAGILLDGLLAGFSRRIGSSFYVLPSSIHEVLLIPDTRDMDPTSLSHIVQEVNGSDIIRPDEVLSDHVYRYDIKTHKLHM